MDIIRILIYFLAFVILTMAFVFGFLYRIERSKRMGIEKAVEKNLYFANLMDLWLDNKQHGRELSAWLAERGYTRIAIYGMGVLGKRLLEDLFDSVVQVDYGIDVNADRINVDVDMLKPMSDLRQVDAVVITCYEGKDKAIDLLKSKLNCPVLDIKYIIEKC